MITEKLHNSQEYPRVAIVGRPNVGKSTLCNRLSRSRRSITDPTPGVTRDPVESLWELRDVPVMLVDTGGVTSDIESLAKLITEKAYNEIRLADVVVLLLDVEEVTSEDHEIIRTLRPFSEKVILAVNKVDNTKREQEAWNLLELGFSDLVPISAAHGLGMDDLESSVWEHLVARCDMTPRTEESAETGFDEKG
ncbi:MAG: EngA family GTP-binding protein, partial [Spirochaeta sp.]